MRVVANSSTVSKPKPLSGTQIGVKCDRQKITIKPGEQTIPVTLRSRPLPIWFLRLRLWQRRFGIATSILIAGMLVAYSSTVYLQQKWGQQYLKLETLQRQERQLTVINEVLKNQLAAQAEHPSTDLVPPNPADTIILQPSNSRLRSILKPAQPKIDIPAGY